MPVGQSKLTKVIHYPNGAPVPVVYGSGTRVNNTAAAASAAEAALPTGAAVIEVRATDAIWLRFGNTGMAAASAASTSILFVGGEKVMPVPLDGNGNPYDYFRTLRVGAADVAVQIESIATV